MQPEDRSPMRDLSSVLDTDHTEWQSSMVGKSELAAWASSKQPEWPVAGNTGQDQGRASGNQASLALALGTVREAREDTMDKAVAWNPG